MSGRSNKSNFQSKIDGPRIGLRYDTKAACSRCVMSQAKPKDSGLRLGNNFGPGTSDLERVQVNAA